MARVLAFTMGPMPGHRQIQCARALVTAALALLTTVVTMPGLAPGFSLSASPLRTRTRAASTVQLNVFAGGRKPDRLHQCSMVTLFAEYASMKVSELKSLLKERKLKVSGTKAVLVARLKEADGNSEHNSVAQEEEEEDPAPKKTKQQKPEAKEKPAPPAPKDEPAPVEEPTAEEEPEPKEEEKEQQEEPKSGKGIQFQPGDRIEARYHRDNKMYPGILLDIQYDGKYLISWDEPDENEPLTSCSEVKFLKKAKVPVEPGEKQIYHVGDKVWARFAADNGFYDADLLELNGDRCTIKWKDPDGSPPTAQMKVEEIKLKLRTKSAC